MVICLSGKPKELGSSARMPRASKEIGLRVAGVLRCFAPGVWNAAGEGGENRLGVRELDGMSVEKRRGPEREYALLGWL